jgi:hypothetical protein
LGGKEQKIIMNEKLKKLKSIITIMPGIFKEHYNNMIQAALIEQEFNAIQGFSNKDKKVLRKIKKLSITTIYSYAELKRIWVYRGKEPFYKFKKGIAQK